MLEILFLMAFTFHNIEEGVWLPKWSKYAGKYHPKVENNEFHFALIVITTVGYLLTFLFLVFGQANEIIKYLYLGFIMMMCLNSIFPHLTATVLLKRYSPGTLTGLLLNLPIGIKIVLNNLENGMIFHKLVIFTIFVTIATLISLRPLFKIGNKLIDKY